MSDDTTPQLIGLAEAARRLGATGRAGVGVHPATLSRWITKGVSAAGGKVRLRAVRVGSKWATTAAWLDAFVAATTAAAVSYVDAVPAIRSPAERARAVAAADAQLAAMGV